MKWDGSQREFLVVLDTGWHTESNKEDKLGVLSLEWEYINMYYKPWMHECDT